MNAPFARVFEYDVTVDRGWSTRSALGGSVLVDEGEEWTPEHLLLAGLARCSLTSFRFQARRAGLEPVTSARAHGVVTRRDGEGRARLLRRRVAHREAALSLDGQRRGDRMSVQPQVGT